MTSPRDPEMTRIIDDMGTFCRVQRRWKLDPERLVMGGVFFLFTQVLEWTDREKRLEWLADRLSVALELAERLRELAAAAPAAKPDKPFELEPFTREVALDARLSQVRQHYRKRLSTPQHKWF